jgi:integrase
MARRKDLKGRVLKDGESQRKNGMYQYRYQTESGKRHTIYSMSLTELRQKEDDIKNKIYNGLKTNTNNITLNDVYQVYIDSRTELKQSTRGNYKYLYEKYVRNEIGFRKIASFKYSDMSRFYKHMLDEKGFKPHSLEALHSVLHPVFSMAVRDGYLRLNPTDGLIREIKKKRDWHMQKRHALTIEEQRKIIDFVTRKNYYRQWKNIIIVLLGTGLRISELCGLTWSDCDFENNVISVKRNLIYRVQENGKAEFHITTPKTSAGTRDIPMLTAVKAALLDEKEKQQELGFNETVVDGLSGFIFQTRDGNVTSQHNVTRALKRIVEKCNEEEKVLAERENREPQYVREFTAHNLRHTFCSRFCENEPNIKVIQEIMGHADISTTMDIYAEVTTAKKKAVFEELDNKIELF